MCSAAWLCCKHMKLNSFSLFFPHSGMEIQFASYLEKLLKLMFSVKEPKDETVTR